LKVYAFKYVTDESENWAINHWLPQLANSKSRA
jgi:hypothetical protein